MQFKNNLNAVIETLALLFLSYHPDELERDYFLKNYAELGLNGEELFHKINPVLKKYFQTFLKYQVASEQASFYFESEELILPLLTILLVHPSWFTDLSSQPEEDLKRNILTCLSSDQFLIPEELTTRSITQFLEKCELEDNTKWKLMLILEQPHHHLGQLITEIRQNIPACQKAMTAVEKKVTTLLSRLEKKTPHVLLTTETLPVRSVTPVLAFPMLDMYIEASADGCDRYIGLWIADCYETIRNKKDDRSYLLPLLKALADKSKFEIMKILKTSPKYNLEIAEALSLTPATMSHHMNVLLSCNLVTIEKTGGKVYYQLNRKQLEEFITQLSHTFL